MATLGLAINVFLWSIPLSVGAAGLSHALFPNAPQVANAFSAPPRSPGSTTSLLDALTALIGAEAEAMQVAGAALQQPLAADIGPRADHAGQRVRTTVIDYLNVAQTLLDRAPKH
jgi:hypothetical protein